MMARTSKDKKNKLLILPWKENQCVEEKSIVCIESCAKMKKQQKNKKKIVSLH
jgi:hypothetical protein